MKIFVAGTDTDIGKTYITAALAAILLKRGLHVGVIKWAGTGGAKTNPDIEYVLEQAAKARLGPGSRLSVACPFNFAFPASPHLSAALENRQIEPEAIMAETEKMDRQCDIVLIEGVGGLMVPLRVDLLLIDMIKRVSCPVILVSRAGLGTINHTLLSIEALKNRNVDLMAVVMNSVGVGGKADNTDKRIVKDNCETISKISGAMLYGPVPYSSEPIHPGVASILTPLADQIVEAF